MPLSGISGINMAEQTVSDDTDYQVGLSSQNSEFVERVLIIQNEELHILPNGGTGDCLFKAVSQAVFGEDESYHKEVRYQVVLYIVEKSWGKYKLPVQIQHINGNTELQKSWNTDPIGTYKSYMLQPGTLGSFCELTAAGELYVFNFASIQEYSGDSGKTYRVENYRPHNPLCTPVHCFLFTGDYDNGHWECMTPLRQSADLSDGVYDALIKIMIEGKETTIESWLIYNTQIGKKQFNSIEKTSYLRKKSDFPFECDLFQFEEDQTVEMLNEKFVISETKCNDLFSVLANVHLRNENISVELEELLLNYRTGNFTSLNYKLITQPHSHGFTTTVLRYASSAFKGNLHDLLSAADLYSFSFTVYMIQNGKLQCSRFLHVDRWGGECDRMEHFFLKVRKSSTGDKVTAHWYHLIPLHELASQPQGGSASQLKCGASNDSRSPSTCTREDLRMKALTVYNLYFEGINVKHKSKSSLGDVGDAVSVQPISPNGNAVLQEGISEIRALSDIPREQNVPSRLTLLLPKNQEIFDTSPGRKEKLQTSQRLSDNNSLPCEEKETDYYDDHRSLESAEIYYDENMNDRFKNFRQKNSLTTVSSKQGNDFWTSRADIHDCSTPKTTSANRMLFLKAHKSRKVSPTPSEVVRSAHTELTAADKDFKQATIKKASKQFDREVKDTENNVSQRSVSEKLKQIPISSTARICSTSSNNENSQKQIKFGKPGKVDKCISTEKEEIFNNANKNPVVLEPTISANLIIKRPEIFSENSKNFTARRPSYFSSQPYDFAAVNSSNALYDTMSINPIYGKRRVSFKEENEEFSGEKEREKGCFDSMVSRILLCFR